MMTSLNSRFCFGRARRADNINSLAAKATTTVAAARKKFHWQDEPCIRWFGSGFCLRFDLTYFRWVRERPALLWDFVSRGIVDRLLRPQIMDLGSRREMVAGMQSWLESGLRPICHAVHGRNELSPVLCQKPASSDRSLVDLRGASRNPLAIEESENQGRWDGRVTRQRSAQNNFHFSPAEPQQRQPVWHH